MIEIGLLIFFGAIGAWMYFTTPRFREVIFGYVLLLAVISAILSLVTEQAPNSHY